MKLAVIGIVIAAIALGACRRQAYYTPIHDECRTYGVCDSDKVYK